MLVHIKSILNKMPKASRAVGAFNVYNIETIRGVVLGAKTSKLPTIIQISQGGLEYFGIDVFLASVKNETMNTGAIPISFHLDHGKDANFVIKCIRAGFTSVHFDGSSLSLKENIKLTKVVIREARKYGVWVQGEVGAMPGNYKENKNTVFKSDDLVVLDDVIKFCEQTGVNTIAASVGTAHGVYSNENVDDLLIKSIVKATKLPFVLHGGSGVKTSKIVKAINAGVKVINIGTDIKMAFLKSLKLACDKNFDNPRSLLSETVPSVAKIVNKKNVVFNRRNG